MGCQRMLASLVPVRRTVGDLRQKDKRKQARVLHLGLLLFSLLLWAQLLFGVGMTAWRYRLINQGTADVLLTGISPRIRQLAQQGSEICPQDASVVYIYGGKEEGDATMRYRLYPRIVSVIPQASARNTGELEADLRESGATCLLALGVDLGDIWPGKRVQLNEDDYILVRRR